MISIMIAKEFLTDHLFSEFSKDSILSNFFINAINEQTDHLHHLLFHSENNRRIQLFFQEFFCECFDPSINSRDILYHLFYVIMAELINVYEKTLQLNRIPSRTHQLLQLSAISKVIIKPARRNQSLTFSTSAQTMCPCF